jgi:uncharacterized protein with GYD domain
MRTYLFHFSYSADALRSMIGSPQDRKAAAAAAAESLGGKLTGFWFAFGEYDGHGLAEFPDDKAAAAFAVTVGSTGALSKFVTVPLMEAEEGVEVFRTAQTASYSPPGG